MANGIFASVEVRNEYLFIFFDPSFAKISFKLSFCLS